MNTASYFYTVDAFASVQAKAVSQQTLPAIPAWIYPLAGFGFSGIIAEHVNKVTCKIVLLDGWFQHAMDKLVNAPADCVIDDDGTLLWVLEDLESKLLHCRARILQVVRSLKGAVSHGTGLIRDALSLYARAIAELFKSVQAYGWAVQEHDADAEIRAIRHRPTVAWPVAKILLNNDTLVQVPMELYSCLYPTHRDPGAKTWPASRPSSSMTNRLTPI